MSGSNANPRRSDSGGEKSARPRKSVPHQPLGPRKTGNRSGISKSIKPLHFKIPSDFRSGCRVLDAIVAAAETSGFDDDALFGIKLALDEALMNAIKHGNKLDAAKHVKIDAKVSPRQLVVEIEDQGPGFDRAAVPDPTDDANVEKPSGRGILLIEAYMNDVQWSLGGRRLRMIRRNEPRRCK